ncbi:MAG: hypothetical protein AAFZ15_32605 [Bacteroidota bacterium]
MKLSITKAAELAGVSRTTLYNDINSGKLSYDIQGKKRKVIDVAELERVYGTLEQPENTESSKTVNPEQKLTTYTSMSSETELEVLKEKLSTLENERKREREKLVDEIEHLRNRLEKTDNERTRLTAVLTDQRAGQGADDKERNQKMENLEAIVLKLQKQNNQFLVREKARKKRVEKRRLEAENKKKRGFFRGLFGL